ncbi:hypothetical protein [Mitsuokella multacida]|uniref:Uncharacterized protein n=1 Tax=Mitsuokella multacida DSM 20544 TaxID=500635 RepID=C9KQ05_9FIRM|nr:hypothetical protein [Mitsuokella multacida]EEX68310.1 hypothetical protein MITSMUL_05313 [Mitsuokella multacida DSM 20544]
MLVVRRHEARLQAEFEQQQEEARRREGDVDAHEGQKIVEDGVREEQAAEGDGQDHLQAPDLLQAGLDPEDGERRKDLEEPDDPVSVSAPLQFLLPFAALAFLWEREDLLMPVVRQDGGSQHEVQKQQRQKMRRHPARDGIAVRHVRDPEQGDGQGRPEDVVEIPECIDQAIARIRYRLEHVLQQAHGLPGEQRSDEQADGPARAAVQEARPQRFAPEQRHGRHEGIGKMAQPRHFHAHTPLPDGPSFSTIFFRCNT